MLPEGPHRDPQLPLLTLLYRSGLRISEIIALRVSDVDLKKHTVRVLHGKGDKATTRGFRSSADDAPARWIDTRKAVGIRNDTLFCTLKGGPVSDQLGRCRNHHSARRRLRPGAGAGSQFGPP